MLVGGEVAEEAKGEVLGRVDNECAVGGRGRLVFGEHFLLNLVIFGTSPVISRHGRSQELLYKHFRQSWFVKI